MEKKIDYNVLAEKTLKQMKFHYTTRQTERGPIFQIPMSSDSLPGLDLRLRVTEKGDAKLWCYVLKNVPASKRAAMLEALNREMDDYRFIVLTLDEDNDVCAAHDFILFGEEDGVRYIRVMVNLFSDVVEKCMPGILKAMWSEEKKEETPELNLNLFGDEDEEE